MKMYQISKNRLVEGEEIFENKLCLLEGGNKCMFQHHSLKISEEEKIDFSDLISLETAYNIITNLDVQQEVLNYKR